MSKQSSAYFQLLLQHRTRKMILSENNLEHMQTVKDTLRHTEVEVDQLGTNTDAVPKEYANVRGSK